MTSRIVTVSRDAQDESKTTVETLDVQHVPQFDVLTHSLEVVKNSSDGAAEYVAVPRPTEEAIGLKKQALITQVQNSYNTMVWQNIPYGDSAIQLRNETDEKLLMRKAMQAMNGNDATLILEDNSATVIPAAEFVTLMTSLDNAIDQLKLAQRNIKNQIEAATTLAELEAIDLGPFA